MASSNPSVIIGCGAHHIPHHYRDLTAALEYAGYRVKVIQLASSSITPVENAMAKDIAGFRKVVQTEIQAGHNVIALLHSWAGIVGAAAVEGLNKVTPGVDHIIYLASWLPPSNVSSCHWLGVPELAIYDVKEGLEHVKEPMAFYSNLSQDTADEAIQHLLPKTATTSHEPVALDYHSIPSTYVICEVDVAVPPQFSELMIAHNRIPCEVLRIQSGHSPFLNMPERVANIVRRAAGEQVDMKGIFVDQKKLF
ncbi:hypothetical protein DOTSEDRAFT_133644 [Dothistroma septosporum NZE10]|uniref:AB hydrolase-1 domain-containing protein n=1 Tax=Dothistroma septosporum (strain NZE10 / CBS 128990) TaxID=675120 RepID=N1PIZ1_DOTSN|nr:hypothetical protein DOTSEDRAFT_133644 [Dothistroma septosporum NZE10]